MKTSIKLAIAAALFTTAGFGTAMARPDNGDYYTGVTKQMFSAEGSSSAGTAAPALPDTGESAYYEGVSRQPNVDAMSTGSIERDAPQVFVPGEGRYYRGVEAPN
ncbi:hypothetical protein SAMN05880582_1011090 [Rhizobium sp. RU20A]|uniref:hypothetical protein n=1 Tax=Rhizobium sp. RU20A TaxID=1907412 RepID=UPI000955811D|nr:hypothetical protein [Rhizobium sp. RU20A]SIQ20173.1 hypothetical protein SAMN05880582_1011090 [Rhizobium sp. RU20A]